MIPRLTHLPKRESRNIPVHDKDTHSRVERVHQMPDQYSSTANVWSLIKVEYIYTWERRCNVPSPPTSAKASSRSFPHCMKNGMQGRGLITRLLASRKYTTPECTAQPSLAQEAPTVTVDVSVTVSVTGAAAHGVRVTVTVGVTVTVCWELQPLLGGTGASSGRTAVKDGTLTPGASGVGLTVGLEAAGEFPYSWPGPLAGIEGLIAEGALPDGWPTG